MIILNFQLDLFTFKIFNIQQVLMIYLMLQIIHILLIRQEK